MRAQCPRCDYLVDDAHPGDLIWCPQCATTYTFTPPRVPRSADALLDTLRRQFRTGLTAPCGRRFRINHDQPVRVTPRGAVLCVQDDAGTEYALTLEVR